MYEDITNGITTVWDKTANAAYDNDVFGLGLDGEQGINQKVSSTRNDDDRVLTVATVDDFTALNSDPVRSALQGDLGFVIMGNDDGASTLLVLR